MRNRPEEPSAWSVVDDTANNVSERALRPAVRWRKITFGNRSREGELAVARLLTVRGTCQMHKQQCPGLFDRGHPVLSSAEAGALPAQTTLRVIRTLVLWDRDGPTT